MKLEISLNWRNSTNRFGNEISGSVRKRRISSASLYSLLGVCTPRISGLFLRLRKKGSKVSTNKMGEKGQPCLLPLWIETSFDRRPLTQTFATGFV